MSDYGRRIVIDGEFETVVREVSRAIHDRGLQVIGRVDVRDLFWEDVGREFRRYMLIHAWSPDLALEALRHDLEAGAALATTFAVYELADGETAVVVTEALSPMGDEASWREERPFLAEIADGERARVADVLERLQHTFDRSTIASAVAAR